jgi:hypothetical protein
MDLSIYIIKRFFFSFVEHHHETLGEALLGTYTFYDQKLKPKEYEKLEDISIHFWLEVTIFFSLGMELVNSGIGMKFLSEYLFLSEYVLGLEKRLV